MSETFAAVDLGSNSFHMVVAKFEDGQVRIIDRLKDMVRIASGLDSSNNLTEEAMERALLSLRQFGQRIREIPRTNVKAVGTNTLRQARNGKDFLSGRRVWRWAIILTSYPARRRPGWYLSGWRIRFITMTAPAW